MAVSMVAERDVRQGWQFEPGTDIGDGRTVVRLLGGGERYEAWLGWDDHLAAPVVIKMLRPAPGERDRRAIAREAETLQALAHPSVVRCFGARLDGERPYLVLEFLDGPRLSTLLRRYGPLTAEQLVPLALELTSALRYLHNEGLLHLDVKPPNVIMGAPPRLIDLSIARRSDELSHIKAPLGTEAYMAPEQADTERLHQIGPATDVWGLGATLYEAANGFRPFERSAEGATPRQLVDDPRPCHARVPPAVAAVMRACLQREPMLRPSLSDVRAVFEALLDEARDVAQRRLRRRYR